MMIFKFAGKKAVSLKRFWNVKKPAIFIHQKETIHMQGTRILLPETLLLDLS